MVGWPSHRVLRRVTVDKPLKFERSLAVYAPLVPASQTGLPQHSDRFASGRQSAARIAQLPRLSAVFSMPAFRSHDLARKFHCDVPGCSASFVKRAHLRRHEMTHTQQRDFTCPGCNRAFSRNDSMARHLRRKHPHLCRQTESSSTATTSGERLYTGVASGAANPFSSSGTVSSTNGYSMLSLRSPTRAP